MQLVQDLEATQAELEALEAPEQLRWANDHFGSGFAVTTSFGTQSAVLLHLLVGVAPDVPVYWIDTGYLFPETYQYAADLTQRLKLNLKVVQPELSPARMEALLGRLWESENPDDLVTYHRLRKVEPLDQALDAAGVSCWANAARPMSWTMRASTAAASAASSNSAARLSSSVKTKTLKVRKPFRPRRWSQSITSGRSDALKFSARRRALKVSTPK